MEVELLKAVEGDPAAFKLMIQWAEETPSKVILGGILTSGTGDGTNTNALGNVPNEVRIDLRNSDARQIARSLSYQLLYPMGVLNGLVQDFRRCPRFVFDTAEREDLALFATSLPPLIDRGVRVPRQWAQERLGIPDPQPGEDVLGGPAPALPFRAQPRQRIAFAAGPGVPDANLARIDANLQPVTGAWIPAIAALVEQAGSLEDLRAGLEHMLPGMTTAAYAQAMGEALAAANLSGRSDLLDEAARGG
jgi:phage gp29-like protein